MADLKQTPLVEWHRANGGKITHEPGPGTGAFANRHGPVDLTLTWFSMSGLPLSSSALHTI